MVVRRSNKRDLTGQIDLIAVQVAFDLPQGWQAADCKVVCVWAVQQEEKVEVFRVPADSFGGLAKRPKKKVCRSVSQSILWLGRPQTARV